MTFQPGQPRPPNAGRKKGSKNKIRIKKVAEVLAENGLNPVLEIVDILNNEAHDMKPAERAKLWLDLLSYCQAKPREIEPEPEDDPSEELQETPTEALLKLVKEHDEAT